MQNAEKVICAKCDGYGKHRRNPLVPWKECRDCDGVGTIEESSKVAPTVKESLTVQTQPKRDWTEQWDGCDVCEICGNLVSGGRLNGRLSEAITLLYTHDLLTDAMRNHARKKLANL